MAPTTIVTDEVLRALAIGSLLAGWELIGHQP